MQEVGAFTQYIDVAQVALYVFWVFFVLLVLYLARESKREGYPLRSDRSDHIKIQGFPAMPEPKTYLLANGNEVQLPSGKNDDHRVLAAADGRTSGDPIVPTGDPMLDGLGAAAWAEREDHPDVDLHGNPRIVPMRTLSDDYYVPEHSTDPRGANVIASDGVVVGSISDIWLDRMEYLPRYFEITLSEGGKALVPMMMSKVVTKNSVPEGGRWYQQATEQTTSLHVASLFSDQFSNIPNTSSDTQITLLEEDKITAYFGGGESYGSADRSEPWI